MHPEIAAVLNGKSDWCLIHGDCREILPTLPDKSVNAIVTDPPYGVDLDYGCCGDSFDEWKCLIDVILPSFIRISCGSIFIPTSKIEGEAILHTYNPLWRIIWHKGACSTRSPIGFKDFETIFVFGEWVGLQCHDYFKVAPENKDSIFRDHPCPKPIEWSNWLISKSSKKDDIIFDAFCGTGTVGASALKMGRRFIGIELDERWIPRARQRLEAAHSQQRLTL